MRGCIEYIKTVSLLSGDVHNIIVGEFNPQTDCNQISWSTLSSQWERISLEVKSGVK